jgi:beta-glucosidase
VTHVKGVEAADEHWPESDVYKRPMTDAVRTGIAAAVEAAQSADVIIACLGETDEQCRESRSRISLDLPGYQEDLLRALHATGKPVVLVLSNGRPLSTQFAAREIPAILEMWFPGENGGEAIADVILGRYNPAGRLPVTVPQSVGQVPYNFPTKPGAQAEDDGQVSGPLYPFGHGLSYTTFAYGALEVTPARTTAGQTITVSLAITNTGQTAGDEVVQLYLRDDYSTVTTYERRLVGFQRVPLHPGETRRVTFTLGTAALRLFNADREWVVEPGRFTLFAGASSADIRQTATFVITDAAGHAPEEAALPETRVDPI